MNNHPASTPKPFSQYPVHLRLEYDYRNFGSPELQTQAQETLQQFFTFVQDNFTRGLEIGRNFRQILQELWEEHGFTEGSERFEQWLDSSDFGGSNWMARALIHISRWFDKQHRRIQTLILNSVQSWSISALKELTKISDEHLLVKLLKSGKQTVASIRKTRKTITLGQPATLFDWRLIAYASCEMDEETLATLQAEALRLAQKSQPKAAQAVVLTDHLIEAVQTLTDWNISKLIQPQRPRKSNPAIATFLANCGDPDEVVPEAQLRWIERGLGLDSTASQEFRACVQNLAQAEAGNSSKVLPKHYHLQQALMQQKLASAVPKSSDRVGELERQVRELSAQLKEADKAGALIQGLIAQRDRLEKENQQLQALVQENAQKDTKIEQLQDEIANLVATPSEALIQQLQAQNQQLLTKLDETQQRYDALAAEMAASERRMKYSDNSTLVAKVAVLQEQLEAANRVQGEFRIGSYVRIIHHSQKQYCDRIGQVVQLPEENDTLNRFKVQLSGERLWITCYPEQMTAVEVFLPPSDQFVPLDQVREQVAAIAGEHQLEIQELKQSLREATEAIARYKDPNRNPQLLRWQQQMADKNAKLYDAHKHLTQLQEENQQLQERLNRESLPLAQI